VFLHYSFDGHFNDDSGNNNHGVLFDEGDTGFVSSPAAFGQAWNDPQQFDPNDRVQFTTPFDPGPSQAWTVAFWHDMEGGVSMPLFSNLDGNNRFRVRADSQNRAELRVAGQATIVWGTNLTLAQNGLFHYAIVADPNGVAGVDVDGVAGDDKVALYVDGVLIVPDAGQDLTSYATNVYANNLGDGSTTDSGPSLPFETGHGVTDELWIFEGALTGTQVGQLRTLNALGADTDGDGVLDDDDNCPLTPNADQADADADGQGDVCDECPVDAANDADADGHCESIDNCPAVANTDQSDLDGDGLGDACDADDDGDGVIDASDNCPFNANADQADLDGDGLGDACDADDDGDGVIDEGDACPGTSSGSVVNAEGCSIADLCRCASPWKNHGAYVACVARTSGDFVAAALISSAQKDAIVSAAAESSCGKK
jgi:hypothetical protein